MSYTRREDGNAILCAFEPDCRWDPQQWRPDHLYCPQPREKAAGSK